MDGHLIFKKSQISIFVIIAIAIIFILILFFSKNFNNKNLNINPEIEPIYGFVESCLKESLEKAILENSKHGGYFTYTEENINDIPYYVKNGKNLMPNKEKIEDEISSYIDTLNIFCIRNFEDFPDLEIEEDEIKTKTKMENYRVSIDVNYPLTIKKGNKNYNLKNFNLEIETRLGLIYKEVVYLVNDQVLNRDSLCIGCANQVALENDFYIDTINYDEAIIFNIVDKNVKINEEELTFNYAVKLEES